MPRNAADSKRPGPRAAGAAGGRRPATTRSADALPKPKPKSRPAAAPPGMVPIADAARGSSWGAIGGLLRGGGSMLGQISGMESPARSLERVAGAAERAAALLDILEREIGVQRAIETLQRVDRMAEDIAEMRRSVHAIELAIVDLHTRTRRPEDEPV